MQFLTRLLSTRKPTLQQLLDIAIVLALIPHLFVLKSFMFFYLFIVLLYMRKETVKTKDTIIVLMIGLLSIALSFFSSYNFSDFSRMQFFVSIVSSLLILAFTLQRLTREINSYLKATPAMLLLLSFFFFDTISMLIYSVFTFFVFVLLSIWARMDSTLKEVLKFTSSLFLLSLPAVVILFIVFPRIAFDKADFGFKDEKYWASGYDGSMYVSDKAFVGSKKTVMEVFFKTAVPPQEKLYFRGSTLYLEKKNSWKKLNHLSKERLSNLNDLIEYEMIIYPHGEKWIYALDIPIKELEKTKLKADYTLESQKEIYSKKRYSLSSALNYKLTSKNVNDALKVDRAEYPKMVKFLEPIARKNLRAEEKSKELIEFFKKQKLAYKVNPKGLNIEHIAESFLFEAKEGYCTHFASSFAIASRILGIPSRVVTGFKANDTGRVENYLLVRQKDAHAWVELYFEEKGWTRFEPTATAVVNLGIQEEGRENAGKKWFEEINLQYMYLKYLVNKWVLGFDRLKQMAILESLLNDTIYLLKFLFTLLGVVLFSLMLFYFIRNSKSGDKGQKLMQKLLQRLEKRGVHKKNSEPMELFLQRVEIELGVSLKNISKYYHQYKYANKKETLEFLEKEIKTMMRTIA